MSSNLTLLTCNYNTPTLVLNMLRSMFSACEKHPEILVVNTSTEPESEKVFIENKIPYINLVGGVHGSGVNLGIENIKTRYVLLVDTDIIFLKDFNPVFEKFKFSKTSVMGKLVGDAGAKSLYPRVEPWYCFMDLQQLSDKGIKFFDPIRSKKIPGTRVYDIGSTMVEDILNEGLLIGDADLTDRYFKHYGGMSWREQKFNPNDVDTDIDFGGTHPDPGLYYLALRIKDQYTRDTKVLENVDLKQYLK